MAITSKQRLDLKKLVKELGQYRGRHTELVSVYIPAGYELSKITTHLSQEQGTATNIKSTSTRKNVIDALEKMIQHLKLFKKTPPNGLIAFSGNVSEREGQSDVRVWSIELPVILNQRLYRCDKEFILDAITDLIAVQEIYGLVVLDRRDAMLALLRGKSIVPLVKTHSQVPGKTRAGGQSAARFERLREGATKDHYKKVAEFMKEQFLAMKELKGIIIGGPSTTTNDFLAKNYITGDLKKKIIGVKDLSYTGEFGLQELLERSEDLLAAEEVAEEKKIVRKFLELLATNPGKVTYGLEMVKKQLKNATVDFLLLSESLDDAVIEELEELAELYKSEVKLISTETREGVQLRDLGKVAAILRYSQN